MFAGRKVNTLRKRAGISAAQLGKAAGVTGRQIRRYEAGDAEPGFGVGVMIAKTLDIPLDSLFVHEPDAAMPEPACAVPGSEKSPARTASSARESAARAR